MLHAPHARKNTAVGLSSVAGGVECVLCLSAGNVANFVETGEDGPPCPTGSMLWRGGGRPARAAVCRVLSRTDPRAAACPQSK